MPKSITRKTRLLYQSLRSEVIGIHYRLRILRQLFTSQTNVDLLNKTAIRFFTTLKWDLLDTIAISIGRMTDPPISFNKYPNASLHQLIDSPEVNAQPRLLQALKDIFAQIKTNAKRIENWRKKWSAHRDFEIIQGKSPKPAISLPEIDAVLVLIGKFMNEFEQVYQDQRQEINLYGKSAAEIKEIAESFDLRIDSPTDYTNMFFQDDGKTILNLVQKANTPR